MKTNHATLGGRPLMKGIPNYRQGEEIIGYKCDWCGMRYILGGWNYYQLRVFSKLHTICSDCYKELKLIKARDQKKNHP